VTLKRLAVPFNVEFPVKVVVPAEAVKLPLTFNDAAIEKVEAVVTVPVIDKPEKLSVPAPLMVFDTPLIVIMPVLLLKLPLTARLPPMFNEEELEIEPDIVRLARIIPVPLIDFDVPDNVVVPPEACVKLPEPVVERSPAMLRFVLPDAVILEADKIRL